MLPVDEGDSGSVVRMFQPLDRPGELPGRTYKVKWPESDHALYITINDVMDDSGRIRPFEIFINSKNTEHYAWTVALTRMISAVFRRGGDVDREAQELPKAVGQDGPLLSGAAPFRQCPKCAQASLVRQEGCDTCTSCGYSKCG